MPPVRLQLVDLFARAVSRPPGYVEDVLAHGTVDGEALVLTEEALAALRLKYGADDLARPVVRGGCCG